MKKIFTLLAICLLFSNCASIVSSSKYPVTINSHPSEAKITVTKNSGGVVYSGYTPATFTLEAGDGYFRKAGYTVKFEKEGYQTQSASIECSLDGWFWGNIIFGGLIGVLIVDPATGAMYEVDTRFINQTLPKIESNKSTLNIYNINDIPKEWKEHLVAVKTK